jgi:RimJ/RimL family protein N-acetyltransferase
VRRPALFGTDELRGIELAPADAPAVQRLFEAAPAYFELALGEPVPGDAAFQAFERMPPPDMPFKRKRVIGFQDGGGQLAAVADVVEDLIAPSVWHIGLFLVPERLHGTGLAKRAYALLEHWMRAGGARWLRLGVIEGNARAERFWRRAGYEALRTRDSSTGLRPNRVIVMAKPLAGGTLAQYLALVPRDGPEGG